MEKLLIKGAEEFESSHLVVLTVHYGTVLVVLSLQVEASITVWMPAADHPPEMVQILSCFWAI